MSTQERTLAVWVVHCIMEFQGGLSNTGSMYKEAQLDLGGGNPMQ